MMAIRLSQLLRPLDFGRKSVDTTSSDLNLSILTSESEIMRSPQTAAEVFEKTFLDIRCKLIELAAALDRIERADSADEVETQ